ncbi:MAG: nuclear transport factor 2 family protein [Deltaproteobacteria bacterium]|nr:nuclear transport factor 2 family protein [Deltaproteobacteria bacterium]
MTLEELTTRLKATEDALAALQKRVRVTEDIQEIQQLQCRYVDALMATDWDTTTDCFASNGKIDVYLHDPVEGKRAVEKFFKEELSKTHAGKEGDIVIHPIITVDGDTAKGSWLLYMMYFYPRTGQSLFWVQGYYDMDYVREDGRWKIAVMRWSERLGLPGGGPPTGLF